MKNIKKYDEFLNELNRTTYGSAADKFDELGLSRKADNLRKHAKTIEDTEPIFSFIIVSPAKKHYALKQNEIIEFTSNVKLDKPGVFRSTSNLGDFLVTSEPGDILISLNISKTSRMPSNGVFEPTNNKKYGVTGFKFGNTDRVYLKNRAEAKRFKEYAKEQGFDIDDERTLLYE